ncbi:MAG: hypothetical protein FJ381_02395 [Verrucomicrobia bacterium]|nr:hypothetical protein [Verrucomicrobiota bacterium]
MFRRYAAPQRDHAPVVVVGELEEAALKDLSHRIPPSCPLGAAAASRKDAVAHFARFRSGQAGAPTYVLTLPPVPARPAL